MLPLLALPTMPILANALRMVQATSRRSIAMPPALRWKRGIDRES